jgi:hypothetical protein
LFNVIVGVYGMNNMTWKRTSFAVGFGFLLAVGAGYSSWVQGTGSDRNDNLLKDIAIANGIDPNQTPQELANQEIEKKLGGEATSLSAEIFAFLNQQNAFFVPSQGAQTWGAYTDNLQKQSDQLMADYDSKFTARVLSLADRVQKTKIYPLSNGDMMSFTDPTNPLGIRQNAETLGRMGDTLLSNLPTTLSQ